MMSIGRDWTFSQHKKYLTRIDFYQRLSVKKEAIKKSNAFVKQYQLIRFEAAGKDRKYIIIPRSDSEEYRRWEDLEASVRITPQPKAESYINQAYWHSAPLRGLISSEQHMIWIRGLIQIRDLQQLLCVNINNKGDTIWRIPSSMRSGKTSDMLFLNDLDPFEVFQKVHFFDITKVDCPGTHCSTTTSYQVYQA